MEELSDSFYRQGQPSADDIIDRLRSKNVKALDFINYLTGQFYLTASQTPQGEIRLREQEPWILMQDYLLQFFTYEHLPANLQEISKPFAELAQAMAARCRQNPEKTTMLRKLLEAKDCAVRSELFKEL